MKKLPRVIAFHDMSGYGKCSLTVAIPVISACGAEVCPLPTALLSTNTNFPGFTFTDFTPHMSAYIDHWVQSGLTADALYSGFLGSSEQIEYVKELKKRFAPALTVIDPVMGDNGVIYKTYTPAMCEGMKSLCACATVLTPNLTEASFLCGRPYDPAKTATADMEELVWSLHAMGAKNVVITGIERGETLYNCVLQEDGSYTECPVPLLHERMHGTGDLFTSVLTGKLLCGRTLLDAVNDAALFVIDAMKNSYKTEGYHARGACFEPILHKLGR